MNNMEIAYQTIKVSVQETAPNTFTQSTVNLKDYLSQEELDKGAWLHSIASVTSAPGQATANTFGAIQGQVTKTTETALLDFDNDNLLYRKNLYMNSGLAAGCMNFLSSHVLPKDGIIEDTQVEWFERSAPKLFIAVHSADQAAVRKVYFALKIAKIIG